jgi:MinD superfamily P-loop ATPase
MVYGRLAPGEENSGKLVNVVREKARKIQKENGIEHIILDGPPGIGCPVISTITGVDKVIIVTEPSISGLNDLQRATELVQKSGRMPLVVVNKSDLNPSMTRQIDLWCNKNRIKVIEKIPFDRKVVEAMVRGKSITEYDPDNNTGRKIRDIWNKILNNQ